jgi:uncharacterized protein
MLLIDAVRAGDLKRVREAVDASADVNAQDPVSGENILAIAARMTKAPIVQLLIERGADPNNSRTVTPPLSAAVTKGDLELVRTLLDCGAAIDVRDEDGATPLMDAAAGGHLDVVKELLVRGANAMLKDRFGNTALRYATEKNHADVCKLLLPHSAPKERENTRSMLDIKGAGSNEENVKQLIACATRGDFEGVIKFVESGLSADAINEQGKSALMRAANKGHAQLTKWLIENGADVNRKDVYGECPLSYAAMGCHPDTYHFLYPLTDKKLRKRAEKIKQNQIDLGNWPQETSGR